MPNFDVTKQILQLDGTPLLNNGEAFTVRRIITDALLANTATEGEEETGAVKVARFELAQRVQRNDTCRLKPEDIVLIKKRVGQMYGPLFVGQIFAMLDGDGVQPAADSKAA